MVDWVYGDGADDCIQVEADTPRYERREGEFALGGARSDLSLLWPVLRLILSI